MKFIKHLEGLVSSRIVVAKGIFTLFKLEARLAGLNIYPLLLSLGVLVSLVITLWLTIMALIAYLMLLLTEQPLTAIAVVLLLNVTLLLYITRGIKLRLQQMSFEKTRDCLAKPQLGDAHESTKEKAAEHNCQNRNESEACKKT